MRPLHWSALGVGLFCMFWTLSLGWNHLDDRRHARRALERINRYPMPSTVKIKGVAHDENSTRIAFKATRHDFLTWMNGGSPPHPSQRSVAGKNYNGEVNGGGSGAYLSVRY